MSVLPSGVVTLVFTDIEGSTRLWDAFPDDMRRALTMHNEIVERVVVDCGGHIVKNIGDGLFLAFADPLEAVRAAVAIQQQLAEADWPVVVGTLGVRVALHTATVDVEGDDYFGPDVNLTARIEAAGHGGQVLMSESTFTLVGDRLPAGTSAIDMGSHVLRGIGEPVRVHQLDIAGIRSSFPPLKTSAQIPVRLPSFATSFHGRRAEIDALFELAANPERRLISVLGPGGIGKTRMSVEAARRIREQRGIAAHFLSLVGISDTGQVIKALGDSIEFVFDIHISAQISEKTQLFDRLRVQPLVLVMDNLEHLENVGALLVEMLEAVPTLQILATSRRALGMAAEWRFELGGLDDSIGLFTERARQAGADVRSIGEHDARRLCERLGGMPLAIELAAAWTGVMSIEEIEEEIGKGIELLESSAGDRPERHRSVRAVFDHSWELLHEDLRDRLARLGVFVAPFDRRAAEAVAGAAVRDLQQLLSQSLLSRGDDGRYALHPLLRELALERLDVGSRAEVDGAYADYFAEFLLRHYDDLRGSAHQLEARDAIAVELDHVRSVQTRWIAALPDAEALPLVVALNEFYFQWSWVDQKQALDSITAAYEAMGDPSDREAYLYASALLALADSSFVPPEVIEARLDRTRVATERKGGPAWKVWLMSRAIALGLRSEFGASLRWYEQAAALDVDSPPLDNVELAAWYGWAQLNVGDAEGAAATFAAGLDAATKAGHELGRAFLLTKYGLAADALGRHAQAIDYHHEGREIFVKRGDHGGQGYTLSRLSQSQYLKGDYELALRYALDALVHFEQINHRWGIAVSHGRAGFANLGLGDIRSAVQGFQACVDEAVNAGLGDQMHYGVVGIGRAAMVGGFLDEARPLLDFEANAQNNPYADLAVVEGASTTRTGEDIRDLDEAIARARRLSRVIIREPIVGHAD